MADFAFESLVVFVGPVDLSGGFDDADTFAEGPKNGGKAGFVGLEHNFVFIAQQSIEFLRNTGGSGGDDDLWLCFDHENFDPIERLNAFLPGVRYHTQDDIRTQAISDSSENENRTPTIIGLQHPYPVGQPQNTMILVHKISKSFGPIQAVESVSFELPAGQIAGLLGPNGAGKSTTIRMMTGYLTPDTGSITIAGTDMLACPSKAKAQIGYLPESAPIYPEMSVKGYLKHRARLFGVPGRDLASALDSAMAQTRITEVARRRVGQLSKGYKQRVGLAAALVHNPPVLILDEPTNGLDPSQIRESRSLIRDLAHEKTLLLCSHILPEVERTCDRVIVMAGGQIRADGTPKELVANAPGPVKYTIEVRTNPAAGVEHALRVLASVPGVATSIAAEAQPDDAGQGWSRIIVEAAPGETDLRESIAATTEDRGLFVRELTRNTASLESLFVHLVDTANDPTYTRIEQGAS